MEYVSVLPGRVRFKSQKIYYNDKLAKFIERYINSLYGVISGRVSVRTGSILIDYQTDKINPERLKENIENALAAKKLQTHNDEKALDLYQNAILKERHAKNKLLLWSVFYMLLKMKSLTAGKFQVSRNLNVLKAASIVTIVGAYPLLKKVFKSLARFVPIDPDRLLELAALSFTITRESSKGILLLILKALDDYIKYSSEAKSRKALFDSGANRYRMAWIRSSEGDEVLVPADNLEIGSLYYIYPGEMVPACGRIEEGSAVVNDSHCTGQPLLSHVEKGGEIDEGITVISGNLEIRVTKLPDKSLKSDLAMGKLSIYHKVQAFQNKMTVLAAGTAALSYLFTRNILNAFSVLLVLSPKPASSALNSGIKNYLYLLNKNKIYLQHPNTIEQVRNVDKIIFDKTGTLTYGVMKIVSVSSLDHTYTELDIKRIYMEWLKEDKEKTADVCSVLIGSENILKNYGVIIPPNIKPHGENQNIYTVYVAINKQPIGYVLLRDVVRENAKELIERMKSNGVTDISLLTGDTQERAQEIASQLGILKVYSQKTDKEKAQIVIEAKHNGVVMMIGDGMNDVLAMRAADVSVSFADNACEKVKLHSDCIIYDENILKLSDFISITQSSYTAIRQTMIISNLYNMLLGAIAFGGGLNIFAAKSLNTLNSILVLLLNKRILLIRPYEGSYSVNPSEMIKNKDLISE